MRCALIIVAAFLLLPACGGGGGTSTSPSLPSTAIIPSATTISLSLPPDPNGAIVAGISDALVVGGMSTSIASIPLTVSINGTAATTSSVALRKPAAANTAVIPQSKVAGWLDGPSNSELLKPVLAALHRSGNAQSTQRQEPQSLPTTVGSQANFWIQTFQPGVAGVSFSQVSETLAVRTAHANIWVQSGLTSLLGNASALNTIANNIETAIAADSAHFGSATWSAGAPSLAAQYATCDANGNRDGGSSSMWIVPSDWHVNFVYVPTGTIGVGGYMDADSLMPENVIRCTQAQNGTYHSNQAPTIVLSYYGDERGMTYVLQEDSIVHPAHEYQHLINLAHHSILAPKVQFEDPLLNEGLSMLAQDFAIAAATGGSQPLDGENIFRSSEYLAAPQNYSVAGFAGVNSSGGSPLFNCATCYSPAWLLQRYLYDRFGGDSYVQAMEAGSQVSWAELQAATGSSPQSLLHDFAIALAASNTAAGTAPYQFTSLNLHASYVDQLGDTYSLSGPAPVATLSASGSQTCNVLVGAYAYFAVPASSANQTASLTSGANAFALSGFVVDF